MKKIEALSVIKFLHLKGNNACQIHDEMKAGYGDESPSYDMVVRWKRNFQSGHMSLTDEPQVGRPSIKDDLAIVKKVEAIILDNRRSTMERLMAETGLSYGIGWRIIHEELHMNKGTTLNSDYYCNLLEKLCDGLKQKCCCMISKGVRLLADNAPVHMNPAFVVTAHRLGYELLQHPSYSCDIAPSDFFLFPEMKKPLHGWHFYYREDVIFEVEQWFSSKAKDFYKEGLKQVKKRWQKCVTLQGNYMKN
ncbi:hypothetical protein JRQ81_008563 [Phrynocephalus forsythii]|uniref:Mos1 transposase HTH domain-containing protein n=1 Tax=Phrynocephalus forsythii TaxID=171643 RepID=A0A9Q0Y4X2_9SAUR|nr:hypothetical protein JRQ81_008563 [Phrynocephalus forsythii]